MNTTASHTAATNPLFQPAAQALNDFSRAATERITHNVDSLVGLEALSNSTLLDEETARLAKDFFAARAALRKHQSDKYRLANDTAVAASSAYIKSILGVDLPARVTLPIYGEFGRDATKTIESIAYMHANDGVVSGSFNVSSHNGTCRSTHGFRVEGDKVFFVEDVDL